MASKSPNKTAFTDASVDDFLAAVEGEGRREDCQTLVKLMQQATGEPPRMYGPTIVGFGLYRYTYASGHSGEAPVVGFSPRKPELVLYLMPGSEGWDDLVAALGKHKASKACLYIKRLADVDAGVLKRMIVASVKGMEPQRVRPGA